MGMGLVPNHEEIKCVFLGETCSFCDMSQDEEWEGALCCLPFSALAVAVLKSESC